MHFPLSLKGSGAVRMIMAAAVTFWLAQEDGCLLLAMLDLVIHAVGPCPCALCAEVLWDRASTVVTFVGLFGFVSSGLS